MLFCAKQPQRRPSGASNASTALANSIPLVLERPLTIMKCISRTDSIVNGSTIDWQDFHPVPCHAPPLQALRTEHPELSPLLLPQLPLQPRMKAMAQNRQLLHLKTRAPRSCFTPRSMFRGWTYPYPVDFALPLMSLAFLLFFSSCIRLFFGTHLFVQVKLFFSCLLR